MAQPRLEAPAGRDHHGGERDRAEANAPGAALAAVLRAAWADVDLDALEANFQALTRRLGPARVIAVVKADAYGHGAARVARTLEELGADMAAVALLEEGAELRRAGLTLPILALGPATPAQLCLYRRYQITPTVSSLEQLAMWRQGSAGLPAGEPQRLHLKVDTGMNRLGLDPEEAAQALEAIRAAPGLSLEGILSHFAEAEDLASPVSREQQQRFEEVLALLSPTEQRRVQVHMANSAAALHRPASRFDLVRLGLSLYGLDPVGEAGPAAAELRPVLSVAARIVSLRRVAPGARLGYGGRWTARRPSRIAVVPVGYADGYPWRLAGTAEALVRGRRVPVAGAVSMDMTMLDVTDAEAGGAELAVGEEAVLLGRQGEEEVSAAELARRAGTIPYEILCRLGQRLPRRYFRRGRLIGVVSGLAPDGGG